VEPQVAGLLQLFRQQGLMVPLHKCGPAQNRLGSAKLAVRLVNGRLVARAGGRCFLAELQAARQMVLCAMS
jgi:hypothetical protein